MLFNTAMQVPLTLALTSSLVASPVVLTLGELADENVITIKATVNNTLSDTDTTVYSGTIEVDLTVVEDLVTTFEMTGGLISATDTSFLFEIPDSFSQTVTFESAKATPVSINGPETLANPGQFSAVDHSFLFNQGCVLSDGSFGASKTNISDDPFEAAGSNFGTITLDTAYEVRSSINNALLSTNSPVHFALVLNSTVTNGDETFNITTETTGTVTASGTLRTFSHPFYEWATSNAPLAGTALAFSADADLDGQPDGISWALGFAAGAPSKYLPLQQNATTGELSFALPGTTRSPLTLQKSTTLAPDDWSPVTGFAPLPAGSSGTHTLPPDPASKVFYRFSATLD
ncbi:hypothetical protein V2O64_15325 [Verrucomicrobiaceae bacterium 227]